MRSSSRSSPGRPTWQLYPGQGTHSIHTPDGSVCPACRPLKAADLQHLRQARPMPVSHATGTPRCRPTRSSGPGASAAGRSAPAAAGTPNSRCAPPAPDPKSGFWRSCGRTSAPSRPCSRPGTAGGKACGSPTGPVATKGWLGRQPGQPVGSCHTRTLKIRIRHTA